MSFQSQRGPTSDSPEEQEVTTPTSPEALFNEYALDVLKYASKPTSAGQISEESDIPIATIYRRIEDLVEAGLLEELGTQLTDGQRRETVYKRTIDDVTISFEGSGVEDAGVEFSFNHNEISETERREYTRFQDL